MKLTKNIKLSWKALLLNKSRTFFAILGLSIGITTVMVMVSIGNGAKKKMTEQFEKMGANMIAVNSGKMGKVIGREQQINLATTLTLKDAEAIAAECTSVERVVPTADTYLKIKYGDATTMSMVQGASSEFTEVKNFHIKEGRFFTNKENKLVKRVAVLGYQVQTNLFGNENPIGEIILIKNIPFEVIGTLASKGVSAEGADEDKVIVIPIQTSLRRVLNRDYLNRIFVKAKNKEVMNSAESEIESLLRKRHKLDIRHKENDFTLDNRLNAMNAEKESSQMFTWLIVGIAGISLLVGGVGVLAVMLLSIRERTGEIGLRISVGARRKDIIWQFLSEASMLGISGGMTGIAAGLLIAWIIGSTTQWKTYISVSSVLFSVAFSISIGLIFGVFPALKAAKLDPILALQKE
ncbi:MAG: ABC-type antimicrobial peptide transport system permease component [Stygiobacter sp.]|nr:MAG: ABC-type antimicrobial peptide transport system permease component [Stygiobacter sp.]KAF0212784.1 MAG: ABC-type antimicrobial peptide transport system permease [Ignavibacteria bacterium]